MHLIPAGGARERHVRSLAIGRRESLQCWGVSEGKARHNSSNVRGVTAGKVGRNCSIFKEIRKCKNNEINSTATMPSADGCK